MKKTFIIVSLLILSGLCSTLRSQQCNYTWTQQNSGTTNELTCVKPVDQQVVWAAGYGTVIRTIDGGVTWSNANGSPGLVTGYLTCIDALDQDNAFVCSANLPNGCIYKTINGGLSWALVCTITGGASAFFNSIKMTDANTGFALGDPLNYNGQFRLYKTINGGSSWAQMPTAPMSLVNEAGWQTSFQVSSNDIWFGTDAPNTTNNRVFHSNDLGLTWTYALIDGDGYTSSLHFNTNLIGIAANGIDISNTLNGGTSFNNVNIQGNNRFNSVSGDGNDFWAADQSWIFRSIDNGIHWQVEYSVGQTTNDIEIFNTGSCSVGWAVGVSGNIFKMTGDPIGVQSQGSVLPSKYKLFDNYPNPFNPSTKIKFAIPRSSSVKLVIFDVLGREKEILVNEQLPAGNYAVDFNATNFPSGVYFYKLEAGSYVETKKMILIK